MLFGNRNAFPAFPKPSSPASLRGFVRSRGSVASKREQSQIYLSYAEREQRETAEGEIISVCSFLLLYSTEIPMSSPAGFPRNDALEPVPSGLPKSRYPPSLRTEQGRRPCELTDRSPWSVCKTGTEIAEGGNIRNRLCADIPDRRPCSVQHDARQRVSGTSGRLSRNILPSKKHRNFLEERIIFLYL